MECSCSPYGADTVPTVPEPKVINGYAGFIQGLKEVYPCTNFCMRTHKAFMEPSFDLNGRNIRMNVVPASNEFETDLTGSAFSPQRAMEHKQNIRRMTEEVHGNCSCADSVEANAVKSFEMGMTTKAPRFQTIMNHDRAPFCNRFCTRSFEQDQWRDHLFKNEKLALDGWRFCYKSSSYNRPERISPWEGDHAEFRRTQTHLLPGNKRRPGVPGVKYKPMNTDLSSCFKGELQKYGDTFVEDVETLRRLNGTRMAGGYVEISEPTESSEAVAEAIGEAPIIALHRLQQKREDASKFYNEERGLARVCNPMGGSYLTARPWRSSPIYRVCEPLHSSFTGHIPGYQFCPGLNRGFATRNAMKYMTFRI